MVDRGQPDPSLAAALAQDLSGSAGRAAVLAALLDARVFAAITATATGREVAGATGLSAESGAELAIVLLAAEDGSRALPVFPDLLALRVWAPDLRPVPLTGAQACAAALEQGAGTLLLDPGGAQFALGQDELQALASGWVPVPGSALASRRSAVIPAAPMAVPSAPPRSAANAEPVPATAVPEAPRSATAVPEPLVAGTAGPEPRSATAAEALSATAVPEALLAALRRALRPERLQAARLVAGPEGPVLGVTPRTPLTAAALAALANRVRTRLGPDLPAGGLDLAVVSLDAVGINLLRRGLLRRPRR